MTVTLSDNQALPSLVTLSDPQPPPSPVVLGLRPLLWPVGSRAPGMGAQLLAVPSALPTSGSHLPSTLPRPSRLPLFPTQDQTRRLA